MSVDKLKREYDELSQCGKVVFWVVLATVVYMLMCIMSHDESKYDPFATNTLTNYSLPSTNTGSVNYAPCLAVHPLSGDLKPGWYDAANATSGCTVGNYNSTNSALSGVSVRLVGSFAKLNTNDGLKWTPMTSSTLPTTNGKVSAVRAGRDANGNTTYVCAGKLTNTDMGLFDPGTAAPSSYWNQTLPGYAIAGSSACNVPVGNDIYQPATRWWMTTSLANDENINYPYTGTMYSWT